MRKEIENNIEILKTLINKNYFMTSLIVLLEGYNVKDLNDKQLKRCTDLIESNKDIVDLFIKDELERICD